ncbi:MAG: hypothetical protein KAQ68_05740 [Clostridiales bacterium]|nr:hypothetical protein [Clostridiales bacterium]
MINLKITKERFKNHFHYGKWLYFVMITAGVLVFSLIFNMTRPIVPKEFKVDINYIGQTVNEVFETIWEEDILATLPDDQQEVNIYAFGFNAEDTSSGFTFYDVMFARMAAKEDDIQILPKAVYEMYAKGGAYISLEDIAGKYEYAEDVDIDAYKFASNNSDNEVAKLYGLPLDNAMGLLELGIDPKGKVLAVMIYSENYENVYKVIDYIMNKTEPISFD